MKNKNYNYPVGSVVRIVISFLLAVLDMFFLYQAAGHVFGIKENAITMALAFLIASIANYSAFQWGKDNGESQSKKMNGGGVLWILIGCLYAGIRVANIAMNKAGSVTSEICQIIILAVFYYFTGTTIRNSARKIFDADAVSFRRARKQFEIYHKALARMEKPIKKDLATLKNYNKHYEALKRQKDEIERGIEKTEKATASTIEGLVMKHNPNIDPTEAHKVVVDSLNEARTKFKEQNAKGVK